LLDRVDEIAKGWLIALLEQSPLDAAPGILADDLVRDAPRLCEAVVRALADEGALRRLEAGGELEPVAARAGELAGVGASPVAIAAAVDALGAVLWASVRDSLRAPDPNQVAELAERLGVTVGLVRAAALRRAGPPAPRSPLWVGALEEELARSEQAGGSVSLLLAELEDADRVVAVEPSSDASATFGRFAQALQDALRGPDILASESQSRAWIIARDTGRPGAVALAERIAVKIRDAPPWRGAPLAVTIGIAVFGEDGGDAASMIEAAEESRFAAAARGVPVLPDVTDLDR
jgi:GGDEF domain-containing protein